MNEIFTVERRDTTPSPRALQVPIPIIPEELSSAFTTLFEGTSYLVYSMPENSEVIIKEKVEHGMTSFFVASPGDYVVIDDGTILVLNPEDFHLKYRRM